MLLTFWVKNPVTMHRLFVAIRPPALVRAALLDVMEAVPGARWQDEEQLHLTLRYIGEVERPLAEDLAVALSGIRSDPFALAVAGVGQFDKRGRTDALWAGIAPSAPLKALHHKIDQALIRLGLPAEGRAYLPHITLARFSRGSGALVGPFLAQQAGLCTAPFEVTHFALFESMLGGAGAVYEMVERYRLN